MDGSQTQTETTDEAAQAGFGGNAAANDSGAEAGVDSEKLQKDLEKQIATFAKLFAMLDSDVDGERQAALAKLKNNMNRINELQEKLTGTRGTLNFGSLLEKIESGGGADGEQIAEYELLVAEYQAANDALKQAEELLRAELDRMRLLYKYGKASEDDRLDIGEKQRETMKQVRDALATLNTLVNPDPDAVAGLYDNVLDQMATKDLGAADAGAPKLLHRVVGGVIRGLKYPVDADDAVKLQTLVTAQAQAIRTAEELQKNMEAVKDILPGLSDALDVAIYQSGTHPDLNKAVDQLKSSVRQIQSLQEHNAELGRQMALMRAQHDKERNELLNSVKTLNRVVKNLDTRMIELLNDIDGDVNPLAASDDGDPGAEDTFKDKKKERGDSTCRKAREKRREAYRRAAIDWTDPEALRQRVKALAVRNEKNALGNTFRAVTVEELLRDYHALHARVYQPKAKTAGGSLISAYSLMPRAEVDEIVESNRRYQDETAQARTAQRDAESRALGAEKRATTLDSKLRAAEADVQSMRLQEMLHDIEKRRLEGQVAVMQAVAADARRRGPLMLLAGLALGAGLGAVFMMAVNAAPQADQAALPPDNSQRAVTLPAPQ